MAEQMSRDTLLDTIKKLLNVKVDKGATPAEAASAAAMAARMCMKHGIDMMDVEAHKVKEAGFTCTKEKHESFYKELPGWATALVIHIAKAFDCKPILDRIEIGQYDAYKRTGWKRVIWFVGLEFDAVVARYLYVRLENELYEMAGVYAKRDGVRGARINTYRNNFIIAAAEEIGKRLAEERAEQKRTMPKFGALIVRKEELVKNYVDENFGRLGRGKSYRGTYGDGTAAGRQAGRTMDLGRNRVDGAGQGKIA